MISQDDQESFRVKDKSNYIIRGKNWLNIVQFLLWEITKGESWSSNKVLEERILETEGQQDISVALRQNKLTIANS